MPAQLAYMPVWAQYDQADIAICRPSLLFICF
jgi:hypothetical protein